MTHPYVIIGNDGHRRVEMFCQALERHQYPQPTIIEYDALLNGWDDWDKVLTPETIVRIESPGENTHVTEQLLYLGALHDEATISMDALDHRSRARGEIVHPKQRYLGFCMVLEQIDAALKDYPVRYVMNRPDGIQTMFDKVTTYEKFVEHGVVAPQRLKSLSSFDDLIAQMDEHNLRRVFVKLRYSSSASGVVAIHRQGQRIMATTSTRMHRTQRGVRLFNSLKIQNYAQWQEVETLINALIEHDVVAEHWVPKDTRDGRAYDLRVVVIDGHAQHCVMRTSQSPMTNLHLGNARGDVEQLQQTLGEDSWRAAMAAAEGALLAVDGMTYAGADVMIHQHTGEPYAIEINAFGDLIPRVFINHEDTYGAEILAVDNLLTRALS